MSKRKPYRRELANDWWLKHAFYTKYMIREGTSVLLTIYSLILAWGLLRLTQGPAEFAAWQQSLSHPVALVFHLLALAAALYHSITWFELAPKAADLWFNGKKLDDKIIISSLYAALVVASVVILTLVLWL